MARHELRCDQWARIAGLLPGKKSDPGRTASDNRRFVDGVLGLPERGAIGGSCRQSLGNGTVYFSVTTAGQRKAFG